MAKGRNSCKLRRTFSAKMLVRNLFFNDNLKLYFSEKFSDVTRMRKARPFKTEPTFTIFPALVTHIYFFSAKRCPTFFLLKKDQHLDYTARDKGRASTQVCNLWEYPSESPPSKMYLQDCSVCMLTAPPSAKKPLYRLITNLSEINQ